MPAVGLALTGMAGTFGGQYAQQALGKVLDRNAGPKQATPQQLMSSILNKSLKKAIATNTDYTNQAMDQQKAYLGNATNALQSGQTQAINALKQYAQGGFDQAQALRSPYSASGYSANDALQQSMGLATPMGGSQAMVQNQQMALQLAPLLQAMNGNYAAGTAPTMDTFTKQITPQQIQDYIKQNTTGYSKSNGSQKFGYTKYTGVGADPTMFWRNPTRYNQKNQIADNSISNLAGNPALQKAITAQLAQPLFDKANTAYQTQLGNYNKLNSFLGSMNPQQMQAAALALRGKI